MPAAAVLRARGGSQIAKRGSEYFRQLAAKRKTRAGGRPARTPNPRKIKPITKQKTRRDGRGFSMYVWLPASLAQCRAQIKGAMGKRFEIADMPALTREMHAELRSLGRGLEKAFNECISGYDLHDPYTAFESARTFAEHAEQHSIQPALATMPPPSGSSVFVPAIKAPRTRIGRSIESEKAARNMEAYIKQKGMTLTQFSVAVNADPRLFIAFAILARWKSPSRSESQKRWV
jgi:hypothetical protein